MNNNHGQVGGIVATDRHGPHNDYSLFPRLNIDISPQAGQVFPLTKCVPWAAYIQNGDGSSRTLEQAEIVELLMQQSTENPDQIDLEAAIKQMIDAHEIRITV